MRRVLVSEFVSLDGVIEDPGGGESDRGGWAFQADRGPEGDKFKFDELAAADALLLGRVTYEGFPAAWPQTEEQTGEYGAWMNGYPKHVASRTLKKSLDWNNSTLIKGDVAEGVSKLKQQAGKDILCNHQSHLATVVREFLIRGSLVRILPGAPIKIAIRYLRYSATKPMNPFGHGALLGDDLLLNHQDRDLVLTNVRLRSSIKVLGTSYALQQIRETGKGLPHSFQVSGFSCIGTSVFSQNFLARR